MSKLYSFHTSHLFKAKGVPWEPEVLSGICEFASHPDWSILSCFSTSKLEAVFACKRIHASTGECIALPCQDFGPLALHKGALVAIQHWTEKLKYRRLQATVRSGDIKGGDWLVSLGFSQEGVLRSFDPLTLEDHLIFGRVS